MQYHTMNDDGQFITVYDLEDCLQSIRARHEDNIATIRRLEEENRKLKSEHWKDEEVTNMRKQLNEVLTSCCRGFSITQQELEQINEWKKRHEEEVHNLVTQDDKLVAHGAIGGRYSYVFIPISLGTIGIIKCSCGAEFTFQDIL